MSQIKTAAGADLNSIFHHNVVKGEASPTTSAKITNPFTYTMQNVRIAFQLSNGLFEDGTNEEAQEMQDEGWVEVRRTSGDPWTPIGGPYGWASVGPIVEEGTRFLSLPDIPPGGEESFQVRVNIPADASTERIASGRFLVSWSNDVPSELVPPGE